MTKDRDPGDAVPPGVAPQTPAPLSAEDKAAREALERLGERTTPEKNPEANAKNDREVAAMSRTIRPASDAPSRSGIMGSGSGADTEKG